MAKIGMDELKASLLAYGLMQNLVVTDSGDGSYLVIAGVLVDSQHTSLHHDALE